MSKGPMIILSPKGNPFTSSETAEAHRKKEELSPDTYAVIKYQGGFALADLAALAETANPSAVQAPPPPPPCKYFWVIFAQKMDPNQTDDVQIAINGDVLQFQRGVETCVPEHYLIAADNAVYNEYEQRPGFDRKIISKIRKYPYQRIRTATEKEFREFLEKGNARVAEYLASAPSGGQHISPV